MSLSKPCGCPRIVPSPVDSRQVLCGPYQEEAGISAVESMFRTTNITNDFISSRKQVTTHWGGFGAIEVYMKMSIFILIFQFRA